MSTPTKTPFLKSIKTWHTRALVFISGAFRKKASANLELEVDEAALNFQRIAEDNQKLIKNLEAMIERNFSSIFTRTTQSSWNVLLRNANDGGANSVLSTYVLQKMSQQLDIANKSIQSMLVSSLKMSEVISTLEGLAYDIKKLSDQSKIVSLNAFIESTHAGEFEKNFAIVAKELSDLSDNIKKVTLKIYRLLKAINEQVVNNSRICAKVADIFVIVDRNLTEFNGLMIKIEQLSSSQTKQFAEFEFEMNQKYQDLNGEPKLENPKNRGSKPILKLVA